MQSEDETIVAPLVLAYYEWLSGNGGTDPEMLFTNNLTGDQIAMLKQGINDVNVIWGITAPLRESSAFEETEETYDDELARYEFQE